MSTPQVERIVQLARQLRAELDTVRGEPSPSFVLRLDQLLAQADDQPEAVPELVGLLTSESWAREWMDERLSGHQPLRFAPPAGFGPPVAPGTTFTCPRCDFAWIRHSIGQKVPPCPNDGSDLSRLP